MSENQPANSIEINLPSFHYVCTHDEARMLVDNYDRYWVSNCGCRESKENGKCNRSRIDLCLMFRGDIETSGSGLREISRDEVAGILKEAADTFLVARPFRNENDRSVVEGICFCCDDCCWYFTKPDEKCDKGALIEKTDLETCDDCGNCQDVCYFGARWMKDEQLVLDRDKCYGCGLCVEVCPTGSIKMVATS